VFEVGKAKRAQALRIVKAFGRARAKGKDRAKVGGALIEVPVYAAAKRLLGG
jgi:citrate lyase beta subunit